MGIWASCLHTYTHAHTRIYKHCRVPKICLFFFFQKDKNRAEENVLSTSYDKSATTFPIFQDYPWAMKTMQKIIQGCGRTPG